MATAPRPQGVWRIFSGFRSTQRPPESQTPASTPVTDSAEAGVVAGAQIPFSALDKHRRVVVDVQGDQVQFSDKAVPEAIAVALRDFARAAQTPIYCTHRPGVYADPGDELAQVVARARHGVAQT